MRHIKVVSKKLFPKSKDSAVNYLRCAKMRILCGKFQRPNLKFAIIHFVITQRTYSRHIQKGPTPLVGLDWWGEYFYAIGATQGTWH